MNKKQFTLLIALVLSVSVFAQKDELKVAEKALKKNDYATAITALGKAESLIGNADAKMKAKFYYLKGTAYYQEGNNKKDVDTVVDAYNKLITLEQENNMYKYTDLVDPIVINIIGDISNEANNSYNQALQTQNPTKYAEAAVGFERVYKLLPQDTVSLYNAAYVNTFAKKYKKSNEQYQELLDLGYTGIGTTYTATNVANGETIYYASQEDMDAEVKLGLVSNPNVTVTESKYSSMLKGMAFNYLDLGEDEKALEVFKVARQKSPDDYQLVIAEGQTFYKLGQTDKFKANLEEAIRLNPTNADLYYNVGVMNMDLGDNVAAKANFKKAIELKPDYAEAYNNLGAIILDKTKEVEKELNANATNFAKYDRIKEEKLLPIYREALPVFEKSYEFKPTETNKNLLNSLYENLGMDKRI